MFTVQDNWQNPSAPTEAMTFSAYGLTGYEVQYWSGSSWVTVPGGSVTGNNKVWRKFTFSPITTSKIRVLTNASGDGYSRLTEVEAWGYQASSTRSIQWLITDHLGTPRMIVDQTGTLANVKRHDYLPFGEELFASAGSRSASLGYTAGDGIRQQFTLKERDIETGLDYFGARYYGNTQGRFTSPDPSLLSGRYMQPQSWNRCSYVLNNPLRLIDPDGMEDEESQQVVEIGNDKRINQKLGEIKSKAKPLQPGVKPVPTQVVIIPGQQTTLNRATIVGPDGESVASGVTGYMQPIALAVLDQGGNVITAPDDMFVVENAQPDNGAAKQVVQEQRQITTNAQERGQSNNGAFYDLQIRSLGPKPQDLRTTQDVTIRQYFGPKANDYKEIFQVSGNKIRFNDSKKQITFTPGKVTRL